MSGEFELAEIIEVEAFKSIQERLAKIVTFPVITTDTDGIPMGTWSNFSPFCKLIRSSPEGAKRCISCDYEAGMVAMKERKPQLYRCHLGLQDCAAPIFAEGYFLGAVLGGQVLIDEQDREKMDAQCISENFDLPLDKVLQAIEQIPVVSLQYLEDCISFYTFIANYIAEISMKKIVQEKFLKESRENLNLERKAKAMEFKQLQAQINPHFLFNTLNTVARMALLEDAPETEELIYTLSDLLRYNLKNIEEFPRIRSEMDAIRRYLYIQTLRYNDRIRYEIDVDPDILDYRIPSMVLQPLVENSFVHGLEGKREGGTVRITGRKTANQKIIITVEDDGKGFDPDILRSFAHSENTVETHTGIGLFNTHERLRSLFGKAYGLKIKSQANISTKIHLTIPCLREHL
ncbi:PocR ligand-binding domain-containing protein [Paenibacillus sp. BR2-3]|uniref:sensor histidine kinase n=1 Tax=Paenibacillus sp. BR2-3 TaxID=3048494 RepID=UPI0039778E06